MLARTSASSASIASATIARRLVAVASARPSLVTSAAARASIAIPQQHVARSFSAKKESSGASAVATPTTAGSVAVEQAILVERVEGGVAIVRFNRPSSLNAMTVQMGEQFQAAMASLSADTSLRCVVLTGSGKAFSAGGDLEFLLARCDDTPHTNAVMMRAFYARFLSLLQLPVPIIAAINGPAIGAGMCVAAACDYRVAAKTTDLGFTFSRLGLHPGMGCTHFLPALVNQQHASRLLLTGEIIKGSKAFEIGLVGELVEEATDVLPAALKLAADIASNPPVAVRTLTNSLRMVHQFNLDRALQREADAQAQSYATKELRDNVSALKNKTANRNKKQA